MLLLGLILTSILLVFLEGVAEIRIAYGGLIHTLEWIFTGLFTIELPLESTVAVNHGAISFPLMD